MHLFRVSGKWENSLELSLKYRDTYPGSSEAYIYVAKDMALLRRYSDAVEILTEGLQNHDGDYKIN